MIRFTDKSQIGQVRKTQDGYLAAVSRVARTGVQLYKASEIGDVAYAAGFNADDVVRVNRHESEVFKRDAMSSLINAPVTINHPPEMVNSENWKDYAVGEIGNDVMRDGESIVVSLIIKDADGIAKATTTHKEVSLGYTANIVDAADKTIADFDMVDFKFNHISAVTRGRAGSEYRIGDSDNWGASPITIEDKKMTVELKTVILGDKAVSVEAKDADTVALILKDHKTAIEAKDAELAVKDAEIATLKAGVLDEEKIEALVEEKIGRRKKKEEVIAKVGDAAKDFTDAQIDIAHAMLPAFVSDAARDAIKDTKVIIDKSEEAHKAMVERLKNGYKGAK